MSNSQERDDYKKKHRERTFNYCIDKLNGSPQIKYWFEIYNINNQSRFAHFSSLYQTIDTEICLASECNSLEDNYIYRDWYHSNMFN